MILEMPTTMMLTRGFTIAITAMAKSQPHPTLRAMRSSGRALPNTHSSKPRMATIAMEMLSTLS